MSQLFSALASNNAEPSRLKNLDAVNTPHPTDTHPSLSLRLKALDTSVESVAGAALKIDYDDQSSSLFENLEELEIRITALEWQLEAS